MEIEIQKIETLDSIVYRPYLVYEESFLWFKWKSYKKICETPNGYYPQWALDSQGSDEYNNEEDAAMAGKKYIKWLLESAKKKEFGTKYSIESSYGIEIEETENETTIKITKKIPQ